MKVRTLHAILEHEMFQGHGDDNVVVEVVYYGGWDDPTQMTHAVTGIMAGSSYDPDNVDPDARPMHYQVRLMTQ